VLAGVRGLSIPLQRRRRVAPALGRRAPRAVELMLAVDDGAGDRRLATTVARRRS
jgi:hypothetical protein